MKTYIALSAVAAACTLAGCVSYSSTTRTVPAPAPAVYAGTTTAPAATTTVYTTR